MKETKRIINDPVFGFINIPTNFISQLINHPLVQRLNRIKQLGLASFAFPGAQHTRFHHSIGAMHLMQKAITILKDKGNQITKKETEGTLAAILLHDIGHGPFSHVLEHTLVRNIHHEEISLKLMHRLNQELEGKLDLCIAIFKDEYPKKYLHQLVSGQLDTDRLDYLRRDCFFTGVSEGNIGSERIIDLLDVRNNNLVAEDKGIYSLEIFFLSRRLMYWQVYHHKTALAAESMLINTLKRAKELIHTQKEKLFAPPSLSYFLEQDINKEAFDENALTQFTNLDDSDILSSLKVWSTHKDTILSALSRSFLNRNLFKLNFLPQPLTQEQSQNYIKQYQTKLQISPEEAKYLISAGTISADIYDQKDNSINILYKDETIKKISEVSELLSTELLAKKTEKYYYTYLNI